VAVPGGRGFVLLCVHPRDLFFQLLRSAMWSWVPAYRLFSCLQRYTVVKRDASSTGNQMGHKK
jgi:hypothetical protein